MGRDKVEASRAEVKFLLCCALSGGLGPGRSSAWGPPPRSWLPLPRGSWWVRGSLLSGRVREEDHCLSRVDWGQGGVAHWTWGSGEQDPGGLLAQALAGRTAAWSGAGVPMAGSLWPCRLGSSAPGLAVLTFQLTLHLTKNKEYSRKEKERGIALVWGSHV